MVRQSSPCMAGVMAPSISSFRYLREMLLSPRRTGSVAESGRALARAMADAVDPGLPGTVVELGPGPGAITEALLDRGVIASRLLLIEANPTFVAHLRRRFPKVRVVEGDAWRVKDILAETVGDTTCAAIVSGLPLLNFPVERRLQLLETVLGLVARQSGAFVQFSYGFHPPITPSATIRVNRSRWILRNIPPARVWTYTDPGA